MEECGLSNNYKRKELERLDIEQAAKAEPFNGNRYLMILEAAFRARQIAKHRDFLDRKNEKLNYYGYKPVNQALKDIIEDSKYVQ
jgi:DNA-directed RNA polymerase subunit K/omega